ncbi:MAG: phage tail sheath subtilisin-like domain-containing protein [Clostridium sp.]
MLLSPGIETKETSLQTTVVNSSTGRAALVGKFRWGPAFEVTQIVSEVDLVDRFYTPDDATADSFFAGANFLKYGNDLRLVRVVDETKAKNASAICDTISCTISAAGSGYQVADTIKIQYDGAVVGNAIGYVTEVTASGGISKYFIESGAIIQKAKEVGEYPTLSSKWTIDISSVASGGTTGSLTELKLKVDSGIYFPNDESAEEALSAPTASGANPPRSFHDLCVDYGLPTIAARFPGEFGSDFEVEIASYKQYKEAGGNVSMKLLPQGGSVRTVNFRTMVQYGPQNEDQFVMVLRRGSEVLEAVVLSTRPGDTDVYGNNIYMNDYFANGNSRYLTGSDAVWPKDFTGVLVFGGGFSGNKVATGEEAAASGAWMKGWDLFADRHQIQANLLIAGACTGEGKKVASTVQKYAVDIATERQDCVVFVSPPRELIVSIASGPAIENMIAWRTGKKGAQEVEDNMNINSTYAFIDGNYKFFYDKYNDVNRWMALSADMAGLCARVDGNAQPWMSPAGFNRGQIQGVIKLAVSTRQAQRDMMYQEAINPVVSFSGQGVILYGDKTATSQPSPFDRINVRRLFNLIKTSIGNSAQYKLFELNDAFTQMSFRSEATSYLDSIKSLGGMYDFRVVCDGSNNTPGVVDRNEFVATVLVKPARSINFITLNFVATSTGADFDEIVGRS